MEICITDLQNFHNTGKSWQLKYITRLKKYQLPQSKGWSHQHHQATFLQSEQCSSHFFFFTLVEDLPEYV